MKQTGSVLTRPVTYILVGLWVLVVALSGPDILAAGAGSGSSGESTTLPESNLGQGESEDPTHCKPVTLCDGAAYYDTLAFRIWNSNFTLSILSGAGSLTTEIRNDSIYGYYMLQPDTVGLYSIKFALINTDTVNGTHTCDTLISRLKLCVTLESGAVALTDTCYSSSFCSLPGERTLPLTVTADSGVPLTYRLISGPGVLDTTLPAIRYTPQGAGVTTFTVAVHTPCTCDTATICDTVFVNRPPVVTLPDTLNYNTCRPDTVCVFIDRFDPDFDPILLATLSEVGYIDGDSLCIPINGSGNYTATVIGIDSCGLADTASITILIEGNRAPYVTSAADFSLILCAPEVICFTVTADDLDLDIVSIVSSIGTYNDATDQLCFTPDTAGTYTIITSATDSCGATGVDTTVVIVGLNAPPIVSLGDDFAVSRCGVDTICLNLGLIDTNVDQVTPSIGVYNTSTGVLCVPLATNGVFPVIVSATDDCGLVSTDTIQITVTGGGEIPTITLGDSTIGNGSLVTLCQPSQVCIPVDVPDGDFEITPSIGNYNSVTGTICFTASTSGSYQIIAAIADSCGSSAADTITIVVEIGNAPTIAGLRDTSVYLCYPTYVCLPVTISDPDGDLASVQVNRGQYTNGQVCFVPYGAGVYPIIVTATDSCGALVADTAYVTVTTDQNVVLTGPRDTMIQVCGLDTLCFPIGGIPGNATVTVSGIGTYWNAATQSVCLVTQCAVNSKITVTATTPCNSIKHTFTVTVKCNSAPLVILPPDYTTGICEPAQICVPAGISDFDRNISQLTIVGGTYDPVAGRICFLADTVGTYRIFVSAIDSCGASDSDELFVTVSQNQPPVISPATLDTTFRICTVPNQVCIPVAVNDGGQTVTVTTNLGSYDPNAGLLCINTVPGVFVYTARVIAVDGCDAADTATITTRFQTIPQADITCPTSPFTSRSLCAPGQVCVPLTITGENLTVTASTGTWSSGQLCFTADTSGTYAIRVIATGPCNSDTCVVTVPVVIQPPVTISCPASDTLFFCGPDTLCLPIEKSASVTSVTVSVPAFVSGNTVCIPVIATGTYMVQVIGSGACGADTCTFTIRAELNRPPVVNAGRDTTITLCALTQVCLPISYTDPDNRITQITTTHGTVTGNQVCFTPLAYGLQTIVIRATDSCGASATDTVRVTIVQGGRAAITCPGTQFFTICGPDTLCINLPITPNDAQVIPLRGTYNATTDQLCIPVTSAGNFSVTVIANSFCESDTCTFMVNVDQAMPPNVICPGTVDTTLCLTQPDTVCIPVTVTGTGVTVTVQPSGTYSAGFVCVPVTSAGSRQVRIIGSNLCGVDTCLINLNVTNDAPPVLNVPMAVTVERCLDDSSLVCIAGIYGSDSRSGVSLTKICGPGTLSLSRPDSGQICFLPDSFGTFDFCISASDGCDTTVRSFTVTVNEKEKCDLCVRLWLESGECSPVGMAKHVDLMIEANEPIGGFELLLRYDASVLQFTNVTIEDGAIDGWEYFIYRLNNGACGGACPNGMIRLVAIADANNGPRHPPASTLQPNGRLARMTFLISADQNLSDQFIPISFAWYECADNSVSDPSGERLFVDKRVYNNLGNLVWDEDDNTLYPESNRPFSLGTPDACLDDSAKAVPERCIEFVDGGICVIHADSIDARGDVNLNEISNEVADAVLYSRYFIYGFAVFTINVAGQIAASDVNADGVTLTVSDLVLMIRIIAGDAPGTPKLSPYEEAFVLESQGEGNATHVAADLPTELGGAHLVYRLDDGMTVEDVVPGEGVSEMDVTWHVADNELRILIADIGQGKVPAGTRSLLSIHTQGVGELALVSAEAATYYGQPVRVAKQGDGIPASFNLKQNYPNPFNPATTISFDLPKASEWNMSIYSITGAVVREYQGMAQAGVHTIMWDGRTSDGSQAASGVYFYRLKAGDVTATRKMTLLK